MLREARGLTPDELDAIAGLERRVVDEDGGRLKLEWAVLRSRRGGQVDDLLWWEGEQLLGFLGLYEFAPPVELTGMVAPAARRRGIATALLDAAIPICRRRGHRQALLVVPRPSTAGAALAARHGASLHHSEHAMVLVGEPTGGASDPRVSLRDASAADAPAVSQLLEAGFGHPAPPEELSLGGPGPERTLVVEWEGAPVGTVRVTRTGGDAGIYGFAIHPERQGAGIGRDVLRRVCRQLRAEGAERIGLEVEVDNDRAAGLYTSIGFVPVTTEDYFSIPLT